MISTINSVGRLPVVTVIVTLHTLCAGTLIAQQDVKNSAISGDAPVSDDLRTLWVCPYFTISRTTEPGEPIWSWRSTEFGRKGGFFSFPYLLREVGRDSRAITLSNAGNTFRITLMSDRAIVGDQTNSLHGLWMSAKPTPAKLNNFKDFYDSSMLQSATPAQPPSRIWHPADMQAITGVVSWPLSLGSEELQGKLEAEHGPDKVRIRTLKEGDVECLFSELPADEREIARQDLLLANAHRLLLKRRGKPVVKRDGAVKGIAEGVLYNPDAQVAIELARVLPTDYDLLETEANRARGFFGRESQIKAFVEKSKATLTAAKSAVERLPQLDQATGKLSSPDLDHILKTVMTQNIDAAILKAALGLLGQRNGVVESLDAAVKKSEPWAIMQAMDKFTDVEWTALLHLCTTTLFGRAAAERSGQTYLRMLMEACKVTIENCDVVLATFVKEGTAAGEAIVAEQLKRLRQ